jgi:hypothetical protein
MIIQKVFGLTKLHITRLSRLPSAAQNASNSAQTIVIKTRKIIEKHAWQPARTRIAPPRSFPKVGSLNNFASTAAAQSVIR